MRLLLLLLDMEDILNGSMPMYNSEQHFITIWRDYLQLYYEKLEMMTMMQYGNGCCSDDDVKVVVCGNCYDICMKLEVIVGMDVLSTKPASMLNYIHGDMNNNSHSHQHDDNSIDDVDNRVAVLDDALTDDNIDDHNNIGIDDDANNDDNGDDNDDDNDGDDDDDDDDDDSLVPIYNPSPLADQNQDILLSVGTSTDINTNTNIVIPTEMIKIKEENLSIVRGYSKSKSIHVSSVSLRDFYPHVGFWFPAIYNVLDFK